MGLFIAKVRILVSGILIHRLLQICQLRSLSNLSCRNIALRVIYNVEIPSSLMGLHFRKVPGALRH